MRVSLVQPSEMNIRKIINRITKTKNKKYHKRKEIIGGIAGHREAILVTR